MCLMTHPCVLWLIHVLHDSFISVMTHSCVSWLIHITHDAFMCVMPHSSMTWRLLQHRPWSVFRQLLHLLNKIEHGIHEWVLYINMPQRWRIFRYSLFYTRWWIFRYSLLYTRWCILRYSLLYAHWLVWMCLTHSCMLCCMFMRRPRWYMCLIHECNDSFMCEMAPHVWDGASRPWSTLKYRVA